MTRRRIVTPRDADLQNLSPALRRWILEVSRALNAGVEGGDVLALAVTPNLNGLAQDVGTLALNIGQVASTSTGLSAIPSAASLAGARVGAGTVVLGPVSLTITGGTSPYGVLWTDPDAVGAVFSAPTGTSTTITLTVNPGDIVGGRVRATVTDAAMTSVEAWVSVRAQETGSGYL